MWCFISKTKDLSKWNPLFNLLEVVTEVVTKTEFTPERLWQGNWGNILYKWIGMIASWSVQSLFVWTVQHLISLSLGSNAQLLSANKGLLYIAGHTVLGMDVAIMKSRH